MSEGDLDFGTRGKLSARRATEAGLPGVPGLAAAVHRSSLTVMRAYGSPFPLAGSFIAPMSPMPAACPDFGHYVRWTGDTLHEASLSLSQV
jgi:hypothetical protein